MIKSYEKISGQLGLHEGSSEKLVSKTKQNKNKLARFLYSPLVLGCEELQSTEAKVAVGERYHIPPMPLQ